MLFRFLFLAFVVATALNAMDGGPTHLSRGCLALGDSKPASECSHNTTVVRWLNQPAHRAVYHTPPPMPDPPAHFSNLPYFFAPGINDPAVTTGVYVAGNARFQLQNVRGNQFVEVFIISFEMFGHSFVLDVNGKPADERFKVNPHAGRMQAPDALAPVQPVIKSRSRVVNSSPDAQSANNFVHSAAPPKDAPVVRPVPFSLFATVAPGQKFTVVTDSPRYVIAAVRWTAEEDFQRPWIPDLLREEKYWSKELTYEKEYGDEPAHVRRYYIEQLGDRAVLSTDPEVHKEALVHLAKAFYWDAAANHRPHNIQRATALISAALKLDPGNITLRETASASCTYVNQLYVPNQPYCDTVQPEEWNTTVPKAPAGAPEWAVEQRKLKIRFDTITRWWVRRRQAPDGELAGGWGDDVEILRHWGPLALGLGSQIAGEGVKKIANGVWNSGTLLDGYSKRIDDVEHSAEPTTDTQPLNAALSPENPATRERLAETASCAGNWIVKQPDGFWRFRSSFYNCKEADLTSGRAMDVYLNMRAMGPALWYAYLYRNPKMIELLGHWADSWVHAMRSTAHGKPAGLIPGSVRSSDGEYLINSNLWYRPGVEYGYFGSYISSEQVFPGLFLAMYDLTGNRKWLDATGEVYQVLEHCDATPQTARACEVIRRGMAYFNEWRRLSGDTHYDKLAGYVNPARHTLSEARAELTKLARQTDERFSLNWDMFTTEVMHTDRVYYPFPARYSEYLFGGPPPRGERYPEFFVTWPANSLDFARAVLEADNDSLQLLLYSFEDNQARIPVRLWRLQNGNYEWKTTDLKGQLIASGNFELSHPAQVVELSVPAQREILVNLRHLNR